MSTFQVNMEDEEPSKISVADDEAIGQIHHSAVKHGLSSLLQDGILCDVTLVTKGQRFKCHKVILSAFSSFFKSMFTIGMKETMQEEINLDIFEDNLIRKMLNFIYGGMVMTLNDMFDLLPVAVYFQIESLQTICEQNLSRALSLDNVCSLWKASGEDYPQLTRLKETCQNYILQNFCKFVKTSDFLELKSQDLIYLISHRGLQASSEELVCNAVTKWFQHNLTERKEHLCEIFQHVHFPLLKKNFIEESFPYALDPSLQTIIEESRLFMENPGIQADFDGLRAENRACYDREKVLVVLGYFENYSHSEEFWCYNYQDHTWQLLLPPGQQTMGYQTCTYGQSCLLLSGDTDFLLYDGIKNTWTGLPDLVETRRHHCMVVVGASVFILGGNREEEFRGIAYEETLSSVSHFPSPETPDGDWQECGSLCHPVTKATVAVSGTNIYVFSGICAEEPDNVYNFIQCYDTVTSKCTVIDCVLPISQGFNWLHAYGYGDNIFLTNARQIWRFYGKNGATQETFLQELHTFEKEGNLAGFVWKAQSLYLLGVMVEESRIGASGVGESGIGEFDIEVSGVGESEPSTSVLSKGIAEFGLDTKKVSTLVDKALFLPTSCRCHNLVISKNIIDSYRKSSFLW